MGAAGAEPNIPVEGVAGLLSAGLAAPNIGVAEFVAPAPKSPKPPVEGVEDGALPPKSPPDVAGGAVAGVVEAPNAGFADWPPNVGWPDGAFEPPKVVPPPPNMELGAPAGVVLAGVDDAPPKLGVAALPNIGAAGVEDEFCPNMEGADAGVEDEVFCPNENAPGAGAAGVDDPKRPPVDAGVAPPKRLPLAAAGLGVPKALLPVDGAAAPNEKPEAGLSLSLLAAPPNILLLLLPNMCRVCVIGMYSW